MSESDESVNTPNNSACSTPVHIDMTKTLDGFSYCLSAVLLFSLWKYFFRCKLFY